MKNQRHEKSFLWNGLPSKVQEALPPVGVIYSLPQNFDKLQRETAKRKKLLKAKSIFNYISTETKITQKLREEEKRNGIKCKKK